MFVKSKSVIYIFILVYLLIFSYYPSFGQEHYDIILEENFDNNELGWFQLDNKDVKLKIQSGKCIFQHKRDYDGYLTWNGVFDVRDNHNFTIESTIDKKDGPNNFGYGILWGLRDKDNYYFFLITGDGYYLYGKQFRGKWYLSVKTESKYINNGNSSNKLAVSRSDDQIELFINDSLICASGYEGMFGNNIGFRVNGNVKIEIDNLLITKGPVKKISTINKRKKFFAVLTCGAGFAGSITQEAVAGFSETKFNGGNSSFLGVRMGILQDDGDSIFVGWTIDISHYRFPMKLEEEGLYFGDVGMHWTMFTPGVMAITESEGSGGCFFLGLLGLGKGHNWFVKSPEFSNFEEEVGATISVQIDDSFIYAILPCRLDFIFLRHFAFGLNFSGFLASNARTKWRADGGVIHDIDKFHLSNWQILGTFSVILF